MQERPSALSMRGHGGELCALHQELTNEFAVLVFSNTGLQCQDFLLSLCAGESSLECFH